jgi:signal transduction histidine kinase
LLSAILLLMFGGVLYNYSGTLAHYLSESIFLRHDNSRLIARLSEEKLSAESARDTAEASEQAKLVFISNISQELRMPLNAILGMAHVLERGDLEKTQRDHARILVESGRGLQTLLDDIIALARAPDGQDVPENGCDAAQAVRTVTRLLQPNAWEKRLRLSVNVAQGLPRVCADPRLLRRVLLKLVGNAIKFTDRGAVEIALDAAKDGADRTMVRFVITDTGPGIPGELRTTLFQAFSKAEESSTQRRGAGLGLAVAKRLVESIGGTIGVESEPGMGASVWITVPALQFTAHTQTEEADLVAAPSGLSLLLFLPDQTMREAIARMLTPFGNRIAYADTLAQAAAISARGGFTAILAPAGAVDALAAAPGQRTPLLALAARDEKQPMGANTALHWPADANAVYAAIRAVMGKTETTRTHAQDTAPIDAKAFAELEKSLGLKTLIDILQSYLLTTEDLAKALTLASAQEDWVHAGRLAQDFAGAAGGLGLSVLTTAARALAQGARDGSRGSALCAAATGVLAEHQRVREALRHLYPDLAA